MGRYIISLGKLFPQLIDVVPDQHYKEFVLGCLNHASVLFGSASGVWARKTTLNAYSLPPV